MNTTYWKDGRLDIIVLGPMDNNNTEISTTRQIAQAIGELLESEEHAKLLKQTSTINYKVHIPEEWGDNEIIHSILARLDTADLVVVNLTPKDGPHGVPSANIYYELGILHSLGVPIILLKQSETPTPFYFRSSKGYYVADFSIESIKKALQSPLLKFLDPQDDTDFTMNRVSQFYDGLPIIDISAAVGLATGYYHNFVGRILRDGSFVSLYPDQVKQLIIVRPDDIRNTFEQDKTTLLGVLKSNGYELTTAKLDAAPGDHMGPVWIDHVNGIIVDLPRTIYPLKISPRILGLEDRLNKSTSSNYAYRDQVLKQNGEKLLDKIKHVIDYHVSKERMNYRKQALHYCSIKEVPTLIRKLTL